jgi:hypothetical protein
MGGCFEGGSPGGALAADRAVQEQGHMNPTRVQWEPQQHARAGLRRLFVRRSLIVRTVQGHEEVAHNPKAPQATTESCLVVLLWRT